MCNDLLTHPLDKQLPSELSSQSIRLSLEPVRLPRQPLRQARSREGLYTSVVVMGSDVFGRQLIIVLGHILDKYEG